MSNVIRRAAIVLIAGLLVATAVSTSMPVVAPAQEQEVAQRAAGARLVAEAAHEYQTMTATRYQHRTRVELAAGTYFYDCVGFVAFALHESDPTAIETVRRVFAVAPNRVPSPARFVQLFTGPRAEAVGWQRVTRVADARPGDVLAWSYDHPVRANGHVAVLASTPRPAGPDSYLVDVWDSTSTPHGARDTRLTNPANLPGPNGKASGLGRGTIRVDVDGSTGTVRTVHWSPTTRPVGAAHFALGRPTG